MHLPLDDRFAALVERRLHPCRVTVDVAGRIARVEGNAAFFGYDKLAAGDEADDRIPFLVGMRGLAEADLLSVETPSGASADLYWVQAADGQGTLTLFDATPTRDEVQNSQQIANDSLLLQYRLKQTSEQLRKKQQELLHIAYHDSLTGLYNRRQLIDRLPEEIARARQSQSPLALLLIDIDHFKGFNDRYGHLAGDRCLHRVAQTIGEAARNPSEIAARVGGEEFALLLPQTSTEAAVDAAQQVCLKVGALGQEHLGSPKKVVTVSVGVALLPEGAGDLSWETLYKAADSALYQAKEQGRNRVSLAGD